MKKALGFKLTGDFACFRDFTDTSKLTPTYQRPTNIHIMSIIGAIIGLDGFSEFLNSKNLGKKSNKYPEFYERLKGLNYSIISESSHFDKEIVTYNNQVAQLVTNGITLNLTYEFLKNPDYTIYIEKKEEYLDIYNKLKNRLINKFFEYNVFLGRPELSANIEYLGEFDLVEKESNFLDSWVNMKDISFSKDEVFDFNYEKGCYILEEFFETELEEYIFVRKNKEHFLNTSAFIENINKKVFLINNKSIVFDKL